MSSVSERINPGIVSWCRHTRVSQAIVSGVSAVSRSAENQADLRLDVEELSRPERTLDAGASAPRSAGVAPYAASDPARVARWLRFLRKGERHHGVGPCFAVQHRVPDRDPGAASRQLIVYRKVRRQPGETGWTMKFSVAQARAVSRTNRAGNPRAANTSTFAPPAPAAISSRVRDRHL